MCARYNIELAECKDEKRCCGTCKHFKYEDVDGFGLFVGFDHDFETYCGYVCVKNCRWNATR